VTLACSWQRAAAFTEPLLHGAVAAAAAATAADDDVE